MQTEGNASLRVLSYAETIEDPLLREADVPDRQANEPVARLGLEA